MGLRPHLPRLNGPHLDVLSLCTGIGGLDLGLVLACPAARTVCAVEIEAYACAVLVARMEAGFLAPAPVWTDLTSFDGRPWRGVVDLVAGGFPCVDISNAGTRAGLRADRSDAGGRSGLWHHFARVLDEVRPGYVFLENVAALTSAKRGLLVVLGDLGALGFDAEWGVFSAASVGAPHLRRRFFLLGRRRDVEHPALDGRSEGRAESSVRGGRDAVAGASRVVADADARGRRAMQRHHDERKPDLARSGEKVADAEGARLERPRPPGTAPDLRRRSGDESGADWPPGPDDADGWRDYLEWWPGLEPSVRRGADVSPPWLDNRIDRLRALGNGVVPLQAAVAFRVLADRLKEKVNAPNEERRQAG